MQNSVKQPHWDSSFWIWGRFDFWPWHCDLDLWNAEKHVWPCISGTACPILKCKYVPRSWKRYQHDGIIKSESRVNGLFIVYSATFGYIEINEFQFVICCKQEISQKQQLLSLVVCSHDDHLKGSLSSPPTVHKFRIFLNLLVKIAFPQKIDFFVFDKSCVFMIPSCRAHFQDSETYLHFKIGQTVPEISIKNENSENSAKIAFLQKSTFLLLINLVFLWFHHVGLGFRISKNIYIFKSDKRFPRYASKRVFNIFKVKSPKLWDWLNHRPKYHKFGNFGSLW